ncbi:tetratricopeptide repeat protein [Nostoc sp. 106C]|uniref:CHAT domain-containing protein n=1 Tax=Nostoc sp. 106C TaxID=1932667 RepID=UPI000A3AAC44|nr:tetratricopeptide repeat protein [Nostoc sp. 106C]OUL21816.1 hypothetical protein BV375_28510 [Nostoc sp. 106C]
MTKTQVCKQRQQPFQRLFSYPSLAVVTSILVSVPTLAAPGQNLVKIAQLKQISTPDNLAAAKRVLAEGSKLYRQGTAESLRQAIKKWQEALKLWQQAGHKIGEATTLIDMGVAYSDLGDPQKALELYNQALPLTRMAKDRGREAITLSNIGKIYDDLGDKQKALSYFNQSLSLHRVLGEKAGEATTLNHIGSIYNDLGDNQKALEFYNQTLSLRRMMGDKAGEGNILSNIGVVYSDLGEKQKALDFYNQALTLRRAVGDKGGEAVTLTNIATVYDDFGEKQKALDLYNQALPLFRLVGNKRGEGSTLSNIGVVYSDLGEKQKALDLYNQALTLRQALGDKSGEAITFNNIGKVYDELGARQKALEYYNQVLVIMRAVKDKAGEGTILSNIGKVYYDLGDKQKALELFNQALPLKKQVGNKAGEATTLSNIGAVYSYLGDKQKALAFHNQALTLRQAVGDKGGEASTLTSIGANYDDLGDKPKALSYYNQALPLTRAVGDKDLEVTILSNMAYLENNRGNLKQAVTQIETAIAIIEDLRTKVASPELRTSYFASQQIVYKFYIDLLMQLHKKQPSQGYDALALQASERSRARSLLELLTEAHADIRQGVDPKLLEAERTIKQKLDALEKRRIQFNGKYSEAQVQALETENQALLAQYQEIQARIRASSPRYASLTQPKPLTLVEQQQLLDDNTMLLQYSLGEQRSYLWAVTKNSMSSYELPKSTTIEATAKKFYQLLQNPIYKLSSRRRGTEANSGSSKAAVFTELSEMLLQPVAGQLGNKRLIIISDGALQYVPFAALLTLDTGKGEESKLVPLLVKHEIVNLPSATTLAVLRKELQGRQAAPKTLAVIADPIFASNDERLKGIVSQVSPSAMNRGDADSITLARAARDSSVSFDRLPFTREEAQQILTLVPDDLRTQAFDFTASRQFVISSELSKFKIVHFATHGILNSTHPELSGVVLSLFNNKGQPQNGFLRLHDVFNLNLSAELVVLSACETGLGEEVKGEGLVGLTRGFMYAGSPRVLVSLWSVSDRGTSELMKRFYQKMLKETLPPAAALRAAQLEMWQHQEFAAPFYWAAFTLQGEWK